ncbi:MAG: hypothetical protein K0R69_445 [Clostridia bacterium]|jgi:hypothetical protein|nr:hypothetical protein [Clostridia bacterium]
MKTKLLKTSVLLLSFLLLFGCTPKNNEPVVDPNQDTNAAGTILAGADEAKKITLADVVSIELYDLEGNLTEKEVDKEAVVKAFNESMIDDTAYIEMLTGYRMDIHLQDDSTITLTSYGDTTKVVGTRGETTYHLISPELAKILLDK